MNKKPNNDLDLRIAILIVGLIGIIATVMSTCDVVKSW